MDHKFVEMGPKDAKALPQQAVEVVKALPRQASEKAVALALAKLSQQDMGPKDTKALPQQAVEEAGDALPGFAPSSIGDPPSS